MTNSLDSKVNSKDDSNKNSSAYLPVEVEKRWTEYWHENKLFDLDVHPDKPRFSIALPPPNITGNLHMGHALNGTLQDVLIRLKRMQGYNVLWQPGTDHAGISTQMVVERKLKAEGKNRHQLGREAFIEKVWEWRNQYGNQIMAQYKSLGVSFGWDRVAFTMDSGYVKAIYKAFVTLYKEGYIYRGNRVTNWCPRCLTSLSDLEVEHEETKGHLFCIKYKLQDGSGALTVATTRPETLFADVAVAVHPEDDRYKSFIGKSVLLPLTGRAIPVIADSYVERDFGTGCLKITPAHDANDFEVGQRHNLEKPVVIDQHGKLMQSELVPEFLHGKERFAARKETVEALKEAELLAEEREYVNGVGHCERCNTVIEPLLSDQWYLKMKELAEPAIQVVEENRVQFIPERYSSTYLDWMRNIRDWCISRQLWWGHRIPIWTCSKCGTVDAFEEAPTSCGKCGAGEAELKQDEDVLDTWFSSALWPFATLGWPQDTKELKLFYPTTVLSTAREIINLWVARMIFMSMKFLKTIPFKHVLVHPVIQTADGKRMSKSKGNAIDPLDMIAKYGADANRFWFTSVGIKGDQDVRFREEKLDEYKRFANKLWNAGRFTLLQLEGFEPKGINTEKLTLADRWILHRYNVTLDLLAMYFADYDFDNVARTIHEFTWDCFCDWYLEIAKIQLAKEANGGEGGQTKAVLHTVFEGLLRALHPIMPFITEDLWSRVPKSSFFPKDFQSIMFAPYPRPDENFIDDESEEKMEFLIRVIRSIRNIRQTYNVPASADAEVMITCQDGDEMQTLATGSEYIERLARVNPLDISMDCTPPQMAACEAVSSVNIYVPLAKLIDVGKTKDKLNQRRQALEKEMAKVNQIIGNADFKSKAPPEKVKAIESQKEDLDKQLASIDSQLAVLDKS
ncbi:MAG: valine--tRNA ligase [Candidatus Obscuribacter phosphatis]|uniref:Valine--tRNA ligase n=1 Tax=Candidatus Obscuribacter phosphatis TaxID=1906157 RepID=A0A8J7TLC3_9BACT|nr:valine--tRNA ligase [Candidatus Obscuribacter phosphatis]